MRKTILVTLMALAAVIATLALSIKPSASADQQDKSRLFKQIEAANALQVFADNSHGSPLLIQEAGAKEISGQDYALLVGEDAGYDKHSTFPDVTLVNSSSKAIRSFVLLVNSAADKSHTGHMLLQKDLSITPHSTFKLDAAKWPMAERVTVQKGKEYINRLQKPGLDSPKSWLPGASSDLRVFVGMVEFEDGTRWMIPEDAK
jgi:hypothetical protein